MTATPIPCPFCGADLESSGDATKWRHPGSQMLPAGCLLRGVRLEDSDVERWNTRAPRAIDPDLLSKPQRAAQVNEVIAAIAGCGRRFFHHQGRVAHMDVDQRGHIWHHDEYAQRRIYTHYEGRWAHFSHGGTLRDLVKAFRDYVRTGAPMHARTFGPWPEWYSGGDPWGYGEAMGTVRAAAAAAGILAAPAKGAA